MTSVYIFLTLAALFFAGLIVYVATSWKKWTSKQRKYSVAGILGLAAVIFAIVFMSKSMSMAFATPSQLVALIQKGDIKMGEQVKIEGEIASGTIKTANYGNTTDFELKDSKTTIKVHYEGVLPDNFKPGIRAVAIGTYDGKIFDANDVKTRCPSKYEAAEPEKGK